MLNGQKVHDNTTLDAITTNAVDANELEPGPIQLVGNDGKIWYRRSRSRRSRTRGDDPPPPVNHSDRRLA